MTQSNMAEFLAFAPYILGFLASVWGIWRRIEKHQHETSVRAIRMEDRLDRIERQFGPNGGGIRQAVNEIAHKLEKIEERQIEFGEKLSRLEGEFEQHMKEGQ